VIVPARNAEATLPRTLAALDAQAGEMDYEVIVVDDGSTDATASHAAAASDRISVIELGGAGASEARNRGAAAARHQFLAFTDADCNPAPTWLSAGLSAIAEADLVQGAVYPVEDAPIGPFDRTLWVTRDVGLHESANLFVRRELFERLGGFHPIISAGGRPMGEDVWFGWRARRAGARYAFHPDVIVHHEVFRRGGREYARERRRDGYFPELVRVMPELRRSLLFGRYFLSPRSAALDGAILGGATAALLRSPLPLLAGAPYARLLYTRARQRAGRGWPRVAAVDLAADLTGLTALVGGSVKHRCPVL
jgi:glycosyltransferase involved in cell wall biosynthesis